MQINLLALFIIFSGERTREMLPLLPPRLILLFLLAVKAEDNFYGNKQISNTLGGVTYKIKELYIPENKQAGHRFENFLEDDRKIKARHYWGYTTREEFEDNFSLMDNGFMTSLRRLDREKKAMYDIYLELDRLGKYLLLLKIHVQDVNEFAPKWTFLVLKVFSIYETTPVKKSWKLGYAEDKDADFNAKVHFVLSSDYEGTFSVRSEYDYGKMYCYLVLEKTLQYSKHRHFRLTIKAVDGGEPSLHSSIHFEVLVKRKKHDADKSSLTDGADAMVRSSFQLSQIAIASLLWRYVFV